MSNIIELLDSDSENEGAVAQHHKVATGRDDENLANGKYEGKYIGMSIRKFFPVTGRYHNGTVARGPDILDDGQVVWHVVYEDDGDAEDMTRAELQQHSVRKANDKARHDAQEKKKKKKKEKKKRRRKRRRKKNKRAAQQKEDLEDTTREARSTPDDERQIAAEKNVPTPAFASGRDISENESEGDEQPFIGMPVRKHFDDCGRYYKGKVTKGPYKLDSGEVVWKVLYGDGDSEDMNAEELKMWSTARQDGEKQSEHGKKARTVRSKARVAPTRSKTEWKSFEEAKTALSYKMGITEQEVVAALEQQKRPPYHLNKAMRFIHEQRRVQQDKMQEEELGRFVVTKGLRIRTIVEGATYHGKVISEKGEKMVIDGQEVTMWLVDFDGYAEEHMSFEQLLANRASRPIRASSLGGLRQLKFLELFCGVGSVAAAFAERKWTIRSMDNCPNTNATDVVDILKCCYADIGMVPDCIWASPPCFTYSNLAGGKHRDAKRGEFEKTPEAHTHNKIFVNMSYILKWVHEKNKNAIFVIENPVGQMASMPMMEELVSSLGLHRVQVDYCSFGRADKKPTALWTNHQGLRDKLSSYVCSPTTCPYHNTTHKLSVRGNGAHMNFACVPQALAELVADFMHAHCFTNNIRSTPNILPTEDEIAQFNSVISA